MKLSQKTIPFLQAVGVALYVVFFALLANTAETWFRANPPGPIFGIIIFLLAFIISALVCGTIVLWHPVKLFFDGQKEGAAKMVVFTGLWLVAFLIIFLAVFVVPR